MTIRTATLTDIPIIHRLAHEIWWPTYTNIISDEQISFMLAKMYSQEAIKEQMAEGVEFLLAEDQQKPVGFAAFALEEPHDQVYKLHKLYILTSEQGKGTGKILINEVIFLCKLKGGRMLELNVNRGNPALSFYKQLGFDTYRSVDIPYYQFVLNDYVMRKPL